MQPSSCLSLLLALASFAAAAPRTSNAGIPSGANSTIPPILRLVGYSPAGPDSASGHFEVTVRDLANNPIAYATVILEFVDYSEFRFATDQMDPRLHVLCPNRTIYTLADARGVAHFNIIGGGRMPLGPPRTNQAVRISIDGVPIATVPCCSLDMDGQFGVSLTDLAPWGSDFFGSQNPTRSDFTGDGLVTLEDLSIWAAVYFGGGSVMQIQAFCP